LTSLQLNSLERLRAWHSNRLRPLVKSPKLHLSDTGVACALLGRMSEALFANRDSLGPMLETFVVQELWRQASGYGEDIRISITSGTGPARRSIWCSRATPASWSASR
jgi:predicted AAA+ superfamily ATPase